MRIKRSLIENSMSESIGFDKQSKRSKKQFAFYSLSRRVSSATHYRNFIRRGSAVAGAMRDNRITRLIEAECDFN